MIQFEGLSKRLGNRLVVEDVTFRAAPGEVTAIVGPTGSGKSLLLRCLCGLATPTAGRATVRGARVAELSMPGRTLGSSLSIGSLHPGRAGRETLLLAVMANRMPATRADELLSQIGLAGVPQRVREYSHDMRQRLALGVAMAGQPSVLVLDDPLKWLAPESRGWFEGVLRDFTRRGGAVLMTACPDALLAGVADVVVEISDGRVVRIGRVGEEPVTQVAPAAAPSTARDNLRTILAQLTRPASPSGLA